MRRVSKSVRPRGLLLLHGFTGSGASWQLFLRQLEQQSSRPVSASWDVVAAPDLLGHGAAIDSARTFDEEIDRLATLDSWVPWHLDRGEGFRDVEWELLGYSLGARVGLGLACRWPTYFSRVILVGVNPGLEDESDRLPRRESDERWARRLEEDGLESFLEAWSSLPLFATQDRLDEEARAQQEAIRIAQEPNRLARSLRVLGLAEMPTYWGQLSRLTMPVELVVGSEDHKFEELGRRMLGYLPSATLHVVEQAGHNVLLEAPERLARITLGGRTTRERLEASPAAE